MATAQGNYPFDSSTLANFIAWAQAISSALGTTAGWIQSADSGQVNWGTISAVPGGGAYVYEIWEPNDGLSNFYLKIEYGNFSSANQPSIRLTIGTSTNGAGSLVGSVVGPYIPWSGVPGATTTTYECRFSGAPGRFHALLWRLAANGCTQSFSIERSVDSAGAYTSSHVTLITAGGNSGSPINQQTLHLTLGPAPVQSAPGGNSGGLAVRAFYPVLGGGSGPGVFNGSVGFETASPYIGYFDFPLTGVGAGNTASYAEGNVFSTTLYGATRTYIATQSGRLGLCGPCNSGAAFCMRFD
jgi:hypothetical protein